MTLILKGHEYKYAVEQIMLALFPKEKPQYSIDSISRSCDLIAESSLHYGDVYAQSITSIRHGRNASRGYARVRRDRLTGKLTTDRLLQRIIKQSFYRAAANLADASSVFADAPPVWGSLTGIRPAHLASAALSAGMSEKATAKKMAEEYYVSPERAEMCVDAAQAALALKKTLSPRDIAIYIGIPFCPSRCAYCSFVSSSVEKSFDLVEPFAETLIREIGTAAETVRKLNLRVIAVYIGGGTPTSLPSETLEAIMRRLRTSFDLSNLREYTVEAGRPDTITGEKLELIARMGADRVCVNPQSTSSEVLAAIGRRHTPDDTLDAARMTRAAGLKLNMDVIAGLPRDTVAGFRSTLDTVLSLDPENITVHTLSLKKGSRIMLENTALPGGEAVSEMLGYASGSLRESGYAPYYLYRQKFSSGGFENTGWSLPGHPGIYNICMMEELCTVLSFGGGGVTKLISFPVLQDGVDSGRIERIFNAKYPREYISGADKINEKMKKLRLLFDD